MKKFIYLLFICFFFGTVYGQKLKKLGIEFESTTYSFGDIQMWENQPAIFKLKNNSKHAISILPLFSENDLEIIYPEYAVHPGETAIIKAIYYTSGTGSFSRKFPIYFNTSPEAYNLKITGNIKSLSPTAYIQCPMSKPEHSKPKVELFGNVAEIESEIPLSGSVVKIIGVSSKSNATFYADKNGNFGSKFPTGNYEIIVEHPNYKPHRSFFFLGQNSGHLKIRLVPIEVEPVLAVNSPPKDLPKQIMQEIETKENVLNNPTKTKTPEKVPEATVPVYTPTPSIPKEQLATKNNPIENNNPDPTPKKVATFEVEDNIPYPTEVKKTPTEDLAKKQYYQETTPVTPLTEKVYKNPSNTTPQIEEEHVIEPVATSPKEESVALAYETPKETKLKETKPVKPIAPPPPQLNEYTVRLIDAKSLEPIEDAQLYISPVLDKKRTTKSKSDLNGMALLQLEKEDYKVVASADNYISGEVKIRSDQNDEIIRIYMTPVSDLFEDIYAAKKEENNANNILDQLSFGKTEFSFASNEKEPEIEKVATPEVIDTFEKPLTKAPLTLPPVIPNETKIVVKELPVEEVQAKVKEEIPNNVAVTPAVVEPNREKEKLDSVQILLAEMLAQKNAVEQELAKVANELDEKEDLLAQQEETITLKENQLNNKENELELAKVNYNQSQEELDRKKLALEEIEKAKLEAKEKEPENYELSREDFSANNVLFLIDVSSSMGKENKMDLLKESLKNLALVLRDIDRVAIIAYNQKSTVVLESVSGADKKTILNAIDSLQTSGLTYGVSGLQTAYDLLQYYYIGDGNNQIVLATDGLFSSVNATMSENELNKEVRKQVADNNIRLSVVGFGQDENGQKLMQKLANNGEGQFIQIKNPWEAKTVLIEEIKINSKR